VIEPQPIRAVGEVVVMAALGAVLFWVAWCP